MTPVKSQQCLDCVAFATAAIVETCFKKLTGNFGDYSEQQMVDCGYDGKLAWGCLGAATHAYTKWIVGDSIKSATETQYPYVGRRQECLGYPNPNASAIVSEEFFDYYANEELLKKSVYENGAVISSVASGNWEFQSFKGGRIFKECPTGQRLDHAVAVVGYGSENGEDYWLIKNSWGTTWGEKGYMRLKRGVEMCGIGTEIIAVNCKKI